MTTRLPDPSLSWTADGSPRSAEFEDIFFNPEDGLAETRHVFIDGIGGDDALAASADLVIGELGFGTGLNFLGTWQAWERVAKPGARLHYLSVEGYPLPAEAMAAAHARFPELAPLAGQLMASFPARVAGVHRLVLGGGRVHLTLAYGEVETALNNLEMAADAWYLDGFAPSRNPAMWRPEVLALVAARSKRGAKLATFTVATQVRNDLAEAGFVVEKAPGFGTKNNCLRGEYRGEAATDPEPWMGWGEPVGDGPIAVIGAGPAGLATAQALTRLGRQVCVLEGKPEAAMMQPGMVNGILGLKLFNDDSPEARWHRAAGLHALRSFAAFKGEGGPWRCEDGLLVAATGEADCDRQAVILDRMGWPQDLIEQIDSAEASARTGLKVPHGGLWLGQAGSLDPGVGRIGLSMGLEVRYATPVVRLEAGGQGWLLRDADDNLVMEAAAVVLAGGAQATGLCPSAEVPLQAVRGQVTLYAPSADVTPKVPVSFGGYMTPLFPGPDGQPRMVLGATFDPWPDPTDASYADLNAKDDKRIHGRLARVFPDLAGQLGAPIGGLAGLRAVVPDRLPVVGPLPDANAYRKVYSRLHHGLRGGPFEAAPYLPGLFVMSAMASHGFANSGLGAELVAAYITGRPSPAERQARLAVHPSRFLVRDLKRAPADRLMKAKK